MKAVWTTLFSILFVFPCFSQQDTVKLNHISFQNQLKINVDSMALDLLDQNTQPSIDTVNQINYSILPDRSFFTGNPFFTDLVFTGLKVHFHPKPAPVIAQMEKNYLSYGKPIADYFHPSFFAANYVDSLRNWEKTQLALTNILYYKYDIQSLPNPEQFAYRKMKMPEREKLALQRQYEWRYPEEMKVAKLIKSPWTTSGSVLAQVTQNFTSSNWYQGGQKNVAGLFIVNADANYDDQKNVQFDNNFTFRMGIQSEISDTIRGYSVTDNLIRLASKLGVKAYNNWFYTLSGQFTTYSLTSFAGLNSVTKMNGFFSPYRIDVGLGMNYKYKQQFSFLVTPISYRYIHVADTSNFNLALYGIQPGHNSLHEFGSSFLLEYNKQLTNNISINSRLSYFTDYHTMELDWETIANVTLNRFLSLRFDIHPRFDNSSLATKGVYPNPWQFKELFSFGFAYQFTNIRAKKQGSPLIKTIHHIISKF